MKNLCFNISRILYSDGQSFYQTNSNLDGFRMVTKKDIRELAKKIRKEIDNFFEENKEDEMKQDLKVFINFKPQNDMEYSKIELAKRCFLLDDSEEEEFWKGFNS